MKTGIFGQSYEARHPAAACNTLINLYPEKIPSDGKEQGSLNSFCGEILYGSAPQSLPCRGALSASNGNGYMVIGRKIYALTAGSFYAIKQTAAPTVDFELSTSSSRVSMREDGVSILVVDGLYGYLVNIAGSTCEVVSDIDFPNGATQLAWVDGYFIAGKPLTQQYWISVDGSTWEPLDFASAEAKPDLILGILELNREARLFGSVSTEAIVNSGAEAFPFVRPGGAVIQIGIAAPFSACRVNNTCLFLGRGENGTGSIYQITGLSSASRISNSAIEYAISQWPDSSDAFAYSMSIEGHDWYVITSHSGDETWVYDFSTLAWFRAAAYVNGELKRRRGNCYMFHEGKHLVGDYENGNVYEMSLDAFDLNGDTLIRQRAWRTPDDEGRNVAIRSLTIDMQQGVGLSGTALGSDPVAMLQWSNDGGRTWAGYQERRIGKIGEYSRRVRFGRLGQSRDRVFRLTVTDPVPVCITGAFIEGGSVGR